MLTCGGRALGDNRSGSGATNTAAGSDASYRTVDLINSSVFDKQVLAEYTAFTSLILITRVTLASVVSDFSRGKRSSLESQSRISTQSSNLFSEL